MSVTTSETRDRIGEESSSGVVLAAGFSRRMGREKALLEVAGEALWRRQWRVIEAAGASEIFLSARAEQRWVPGDVPVVHDAVPDAGPLGGIVAALERMDAGHAHLMVLAVDLPRMEAAWFRRLAAACGRGAGAAGWSARGAEETKESVMGKAGVAEASASGKGSTAGGGFFEPLAAIYPREILPAARAALRAGERSLQRLIAGAVERGIMRACPIAADEAAWFENWNEAPSRERGEGKSPNT